MNMKKIAFVAFAVALGLAAQGEALYWQASDIKSSSYKTAGNQTYLAYIFASTDSGPNTAMMFANDNGKNSMVSRETILDMLANNLNVTTYAFRNATIKEKGQGASYSDTKGRLNSYNADTGTAYYSNQAVGWIGDTGYVDLFAVILDGTSWSTAKNYMYLAKSAEGTIYTTADAEGTKTFNFGSQANNTWYAIGTAIPEPTSGLLLVLGMATLALKRKRA